MSSEGGHRSSVSWWSDGRVASTNRENGGGTDASNPQDVLTLGQWYTFRLEREGTTMRAYFNDKPLTGTIGTKTPTGRIAIGAYNATAQFDDVRVTLF